jgi:hypothetical protein
MTLSWRKLALMVAALGLNKLAAPALTKAKVLLWILQVMLT